MTKNCRAYLLAALAFGIGIAIPQFKLTTVSAQAPTTLLRGSYVFQTSSPATPASADVAAGVGLMRLDGNGGVSGFVTATIMSAEVSQVTSGSLPISGTWAQRTDGTGTLTMAVGDEAPDTFAIVISDNGAGFYLVSTSGTEVVSGTARRQ